MQRHIQENNIYFGSAPKYGSVPRVKLFPHHDNIIPPNILSDVGTTRSASKTLATLFGQPIFDYPKPVPLMERLITIATPNSHDSIIMDFFAGSGTTTHAVMRLNAKDGKSRRSIAIQRPEPCPIDSTARKNGYPNIAAIARERIKKAAKAIQKTDHAKRIVGLKVFKVD